MDTKKRKHELDVCSSGIKRLCSGPSNMKRGCPIGSHGAVCGKCHKCDRSISVADFRPGFCIVCCGWCCEYCAPYDGDGARATYDHADHISYHTPIDRSRLEDYDNLGELVCPAYDRLWNRPQDDDVVEPKLMHPFYAVCSTCRSAYVTYRPLVDTSHDAVHLRDYLQSFPTPLQLFILEYFGMTTAFVLDALGNWDHGELDDELKHSSNFHPYVQEQCTNWAMQMELALHWNEYLERLQRKCDVKKMIQQALDSLEMVIDELWDARRRLDVVDEFASRFLTTDDDPTQRTWVATIHFFAAVQGGGGQGKEIHLCAIAPNARMARRLWFVQLTANDGLDSCHDKYGEHDSVELMLQRCRGILSDLLICPVLELGGSGVDARRVVVSWSNRYNP
jgi:hypothetical protein